MGQYDRARRRSSRKTDVRLTALQSSGSSLNERFRRSKRRRARKPPSRRFLAPRVLLLIVVLCGIALLASTVFGGGEVPITVVVEEGDALASVADKLEEAGVISSPTLFELKARIEGAATEIKPGEYQFAPGEDADEILESLSAGDSVSAFEVAIPEGLTLTQTAQVIEEQSSISAEEFEAAAKKTDYGYTFLDDQTIETTEGFLFPKKYKFEKNADAPEVVKRLLEQYRIETKDLDFAEAREFLDLTEYQILTVASLVERESANPEERPLVASVIYNRIRAKMPLQVDATIQYALGQPKENLTLTDLDVDSPYNTYVKPGLPPGPIANPSRESIEAALQPAQTDYLYYVLEAGGKEHFFTDAYDEFLEVKKKAEDGEDGR
ncbi:MAG TPA: endolytic transglycosylase MltG [Rubrobacteraceae bacterium]|nr:endolytic transglycosylase MltG [Rubrobacteraceae bacterium]